MGDEIAEWILEFSLRRSGTVAGQVSLSAQHNFLEGQGIADCITSLIVVKVDIDRVKCTSPFSNPLAPLPKTGIIVATPVLSLSGSVQADISKVCGDSER